MKTNRGYVELLQISETLGLEFESGVKQSFVQDIDYPVFKVINFFPELIIAIRSIITKKKVRFKRSGIKGIEGLLISFHNFFDDGYESGSLIEDKPHVTIAPLHFAGEIKLPLNAHRKQILLLISTPLLQNYLGGDKGQFNFLFSKESQFFMEETMTPDLLEIANELGQVDEEKLLPDFYFKLKAMQLLYGLFRNLSKREISDHRNITAGELKSVYSVRALLLSELDTPTSIQTLVEKAGMNEQKLRKLFVQIFGMGIYEYFQHHRMQEAARLIKVEKLSVSEVGYKLGFSNLSHFGRVFEQHFGMKPKKWSNTPGKE